MTVRTEMIKRLRELGDQRTPRQGELLATCEDAEAASARADALDREWRERED